jgi:hypothetical protein
MLGLKRSCSHHALLLIMLEAHKQAEELLTAHQEAL